MLKIHRHGGLETIHWGRATVCRTMPNGSIWSIPTMPSVPRSNGCICASLPAREDINSLGLSSRHHDNQRVLSLHARLYADHLQGKPSPLGCW